MEETKVEMLKISTVIPAVPSRRQSMFLSNLDLFWMPVSKPQRLLFYRLLPTNEYSSVLDGLKKSLSSVLVHFYPFAGQLIIGQESGRPEIDCNDGGVEFVEASSNINFQDLEKEGFQRKPFFKSLVQIAHPFQQHETYNTPLLSIQVTGFERGGICIGTAFHHVVADGNSFWHFMKSWAECNRNLPISQIPHHSRTVFKRENRAPVAISYKAYQGITGAHIFKFSRDELQAEDGKTISTSGTGSQKDENSIWKLSDQKTETIYKTFCFTEEIITALKERTRASTSLVAVAAQFWRCLVKAQKIAEEEPVYFGVLADCRGRMKPALPPTYFGNCLCLGVAKTTAGKLLNEKVCFAARVMEEVIRSCTAEEEVSNMIEWVECGKRDLLSLLGETQWQNGTNVIGSHRFPAYEIDYGWGRALNVQAAAMTEIGGMFVDGGNDGRSIHVSTRLPPHQMESLTRLLFLHQE
ncbi:hypothetical protein SUGI_0989890 [Cryptomeria japonica]|uniref:omega-hydroxypalmitate O-feruloyl transferase-like n=1 Tax=Cryptomeria japonica TaxID=3369 RepID=UPI002414B4AD|nr:omega-hydroxypalmitate O-feruloyl transferase-like [Cryptomeria japonica]GLJ46915.1 hypothetical protein SUGI_0989890 [Cryptomeria japonica]